MEDITENEAKEVTISAEDDDFSGDLELHINQGHLSPEIIHMENGSATVSLSFDTSQEDALLSIISQDHPLLSGTSQAFSIQHRTEENFFTLPGLSDMRAKEDLQIQIYPEDTNYDGDITIYLQDETGKQQRLYAIGKDAQGNYFFPYQAQETDIGKTFQFFLQDETKPYLQGTSIPFTILPARQDHHHGGARIIQESFFNQGSDTTEMNTEEQEETENPPQENTEEEVLETNNEERTEEENKKETEEPNFLLENQCFDIHSIYPSLSKQRRRLLKSIPEERENVKHLQEKLKNLNFLQGNIDGDFGNQTQEALQDFQTQHNLSPDGIFGKNTARYIDTHCSQLQKKREITEETIEDGENNNEGNTENSTNTENDDGNSWLGEFLDNLGSWWNNLFGGESDEQSFGQDNGDVNKEEEKKVLNNIGLNKQFKKSDVVVENYDNIKIIFGPNAIKESISSYTIKIMKDILIDSKNKSIIITSTYRTPERQARAMFNNIRDLGIDHELNLYGRYGDMVIREYPNLQAMIDKIYEIGPSKISSHMKDFNKINVFDIAPSSVKKRPSFEFAVESESRVNKFLKPPRDRSYHLEVNQINEK